VEENADQETNGQFYISLSIENDDYDEDGNNIKDKLIEALEKIATGEIAGEPHNYKDSLAIVKGIASEALVLVFPK
jgi:hypothetical protein